MPRIINLDGVINDLTGVPIKNEIVKLYSPVKMELPYSPSETKYQLKERIEKDLMRVIGDVRESEGNVNAYYIGNLDMEVLIADTYRGMITPLHCEIEPSELLVRKWVFDLLLFETKYKIMRWR